jgi:pyruvate-formate lyase
MNNADCFRREKYASDVINLRNTAWYTDIHADYTAQGIIVLLPHGRIIAGYEWTANGEKVYFPEIFDDESDAAHMADEHARVFAESSREDSQRYEDARTLENAIEDSIDRLRECIALRHRSCMAYVRDEIAELIEKIRADRETLATEYKDCI